MFSHSARYIDFLLNYKSQLLWLITAITLLFTFSLFNLRVNSSPYFLSTDHPSRIHEADIERLFTNSGEQLLVVLESKQGVIFEQETLDAVKQLSNLFQSIQLSEHIKESDLNFLRKDAHQNILVDGMIDRAIVISGV